MINLLFMASPFCYLQNAAPGRNAAADDRIRLLAIAIIAELKSLDWTWLSSA
jgi:hypothetical protein